MPYTETFSAIVSIRNQADGRHFTRPFFGDASGIVARAVVYNQDFQLLGRNILAGKIIANAREGARQARRFVVGGNDNGEVGGAESFLAGSRRYGVPAVVSQQRDETASVQRLLSGRAVAFYDAKQFLLIGFSDRYHQAAAFGQLFHQRRRNGGSAGGDEDSVVER